MSTKAKKQEAPENNNTATLSGLYADGKDEAVTQGLAAERDQSSIVKPAYDKDANPEEVFGGSAGVEAQVTQVSRETAAALAKYPKEKVVIPKDKLNPEDSFVVCGINGWNIQIKRDVPVLLPTPVVDLLAEAGYSPTHVR